MPKIYEEIILNCSRERAFNEISTVDFMKKLDPNYGLNTELILQNERLIRSISNVEKIGNVEIERIIIPENFTIITQRRPPLAPFIYQISLQLFIVYEDRVLLKWLNEFELDANNKSREEYILSAVKRNDFLNLQKIQSLYNSEV